MSDRRRETLPSLASPGPGSRARIAIVCFSGNVTRNNESDCWDGESGGRTRGTRERAGESTENCSLSGSQTGFFRFETARGVRRAFAPGTVCLKASNCAGRRMREQTLGPVCCRGISWLGSFARSPRLRRGPAPENTIARTHFTADFHVADETKVERTRGRARDERRETLAGEWASNAGSLFRSRSGYNENVSWQIAIMTSARGEREINREGPDGKSSHRLFGSKCVISFGNLNKLN